MKIVGSIVATAAIIASAGAGQLTNADLRAPAQPFTETVFGRTIEDPYRWMERPERAAEVTAFIHGSSAHTVARLAAMPGRTPLRDRIVAALNAGVSYSDVQQARGLTFYRRLDPGAQLAKLVMRAADGRERILYDAEAGGRIGAAIGGYSVSPHGRLVSINLITAGNEAGETRFLDVASGEFLPDRLSPTWSGTRVAWLDERTISYTRLQDAGPGVDQLQNRRLYVHRLGGGVSSRPLLGAGVPGAPPFLPQEGAYAETNESSRWVLAGGTSARVDGRQFVALRTDVAAGRPNWRVITGYEDQVIAETLYGDRLYLLTNRDALTGKVLRVDLNRPGGVAQATVVLPAGEVILQQMVATRRGLYVLGQADGVSRLFFLPDGTSEPVEIVLPMRGVLSPLTASVSRDRAFIRMQDYFTAPRWFAIDGADVAPIGLDSPSYRLDGATQRREEAVSADGTRVPLDILLPPGAGNGPAPVLLEAYGSYGISSVEPYYTGVYFGLLESGGGAAFCGTRGGGERGRAWHEAGREANKPNAHADLIACAERLIALGITTPDRLTVTGASAGGLLAPPVALLRPDLFGGLVANAATLNASRLAAAENGSGQFAEMGDPGTEQGFRALLAQDAYQMLWRAGDMPNTLLTVGLNDRRVPPWMSAKFAALALARFGDRRLVLIRTDADQGHGIGSARQAQIEQYADIFAFVLAQGRMAGFTP